MDAYVVGPVFSRSSPPGLLTFFLNKEKNYSLESLVRKSLLLFKYIYQQIPKWSTINNFLFFFRRIFFETTCMFLLQGNPQWRRTLCQNVKVYPISNKRYVILQFSKLVRVFLIKKFRKEKKICICPSICWKILILAILEVLFSTKCLHPPNW